MNLQEVIHIASKGEGLYAEFKKKATHPEKIVREVIAMANTEGGHLFIGVDDDRTVSGQRYIEEEVYVMDKAIRELVYPAMDFSRTIIPFNPKKGVAVYKIMKSENRPHFLYENNKKKAYVRVGDRSIQASREVWEILKREKKRENILIRFGEKENTLMKALTERAAITLTEYMKIAKLPVYIASKTLVRLVLANVLRIIPQENEDLFMLKDPQ